MGLPRMSADSDWLKPDDVADLLGIDVVQLRRRARSGEIPGGKFLLPRTLRFERVVLEEAGLIAPRHNAAQPLQYRPSTGVFAAEVVYFVKSSLGPFIKIGTTKQLWRRFLQLRVSHPGPIELLGIISGGSTVESDLHSRFEKYHHHGEWYLENRDLLRFINSQTHLPQGVWK